MLQIGIIIDSPRARAWVANVVREVQTSPEYRLAVLARVARPGRRRVAGPGRSAWSTALFRLYRWWDYHVYRSRQDAFAPVDLRQCRAPLPIARWPVPAAGFESQYAHALEALSAAGLDVLLDLSSLPLPKAIARCARFGVWSFHDGQPREYPQLPPLFHEMYAGAPIAAAVVQCRTGIEDAARVLCRGTFILDRKSFALSRNRSAWTGTAYLLRRLNDLACRGWHHLQSAPTWQEHDPYAKRPDRAPGNGTTLRFLARMVRRRVDRWSERLLSLHPWLIAYRAGPVGFLLPPADRFYADPFPFEHQGRRFIFFEDSRHRPVKGVISCVELDRAGCAGQPRTALEADCHLSYPFLFEWQGRAYMIPETFQHHRIELYRAEDFPDRWVFDRVLVDGVSGVDATLAPFDGLYWMFVSQISPSGAFGPELSLYYADTPLGPWVPHPGNPVVTDVRRARPAGRPFEVGSRELRVESRESRVETKDSGSKLSTLNSRLSGLIRPGQDCSVRWGFAISFNRVELLSRTEYRERAVARLEPDWFPGATATHTYNHSQSVEVFDVQVPVRRRTNLLRASNEYARLCDLCRSDDFRSIIDRNLTDRMTAIARALAAAAGQPCDAM